MVALVRQTVILALLSHTLVVEAALLLMALRGQEVLEVVETAAFMVQQNRLLVLQTLAAGVAAAVILQELTAAQE
jgi:hypothetical protein